jgi:hypothetical protein
MAITLSDGTTTLTLDPDLYWSDEYDWAATEQAIERTLTGALIVQAAGRIAGRPITLEPEDDNSSWMTRADMDTLAAWANTPGQTMTLTLRGIAHNVIFRHHDGGPYTAKPVVHYSDPAGTDWVLVTLRFTTVE